MNNISLKIEYENVDDILTVMNDENTKLVRHCVNSLDFGIRHGVKSLPMFELTNRRNGSLVVVCLPERDYRKTLTFLKNWAIQLEEFESAGKSVELIKQLKTIKK